MGLRHKKARIINYTYANILALVNLNQQHKHNKQLTQLHEHSFAYPR